MAQAKVTGEAPIEGAGTQHKIRLEARGAAVWAPLVEVMTVMTLVAAIVMIIATGQGALGKVMGIDTLGIFKLM